MQGLTNPIGELHELVAKLSPGTPLNFKEEKMIAGFVCTASVYIYNREYSRQGEPKSTKKEAKKSAASLLLNDIKVTDSVQPTEPNDTDTKDDSVASYNALEQTSDCYADELAANSESSCVICTQCSSVLGSLVDFILFQKSESEIEFSLKESCISSYISTEKLKIKDNLHNSSSRFHTSFWNVVCGKCNRKLGVEKWNGLSKMVVFGCNKVHVDCLKEFAGRKWVTMKNHLHHIGVKVISEYTSLSTDVEYNPHKELVVAASSECFEWKDLVKNGLKPRPYQIDAYHASLITNIVIAMPTGFGKTLIASMTLHRMTLLNPERLGILIVSRIPLVYQQAAAIEEHTWLPVCRLCGETSTPYLIKKIKNRCANIIVATAGSLLDILQKKILYISNFSCMVFDECHHVNKKHDYNRILLEYVSKCPSKIGPRLIGLSASVVSAKTVATAAENVRKLKIAFRDAILWNTRFDFDQNETKWHVEVNTCNQEEMNEYLFQKLKGYISCLSKLIGTEMHSMDSIMDPQSSWAAILGWARKLRRQVDSSIKADVECLIGQVEVAVAALECNELLGPYYVYKLLLESSRADDMDAAIPLPLLPQLESKYNISELIERESSVEDTAELLSHRVLKLELEIRNLINMSTNSRVIIFVDTKKAAKMLKSRLDISIREWKSAIIVGHSGYDGMSWGEQKKILENFRCGKIRLLISTSVLEEGLDVQSCDRVFRLGGRCSLIQMVQSRGRARAQNSKLQMILTEKEQDRMIKLMAEERNLQLVLEEECQRENYDSIRRKLDKLSVPQVNVDKDENNSMPCAPVDDYSNFTEHYALKLFVHGGGDHKMVDYCQNELSDYAKLHHFEQTSINASVDLQCSAFDKDTAVLVASFSSNTKSFFPMFCSNWKFQFQIRTNDDVHLNDVYMAVPSSEVFPEGHVNVEPIGGITVGYLVDKRRFEKCYRLGSDELVYSSLTLTPGKSWKLTATHKDGDVHISDPVTKLNSFALITFDTVSNTITLYLILSSPPAVVICDRVEGKSERVSLHSLSKSNIYQLAQKDLEALKGLPVIAISFPLSEWETLLNAVGNRNILGVRTYITRVHQTERRLDTYERNVINSFSEKDQLECIWALESLKAHSFMIPLNPHVILTLHRYIHNALKDGKGIIAGITRALYRLPVVLAHSSPWTDAFEMFRNILSSVETFPNDFFGEEYISVPRVVVTPSRILCQPYTWVKSNRLLRIFTPDFTFIYVAFRDEDGQYLFNTHVFTSRYQNILDCGLEVCGRLLSFVAGSGSQIRGQVGTFVLGDESVASSIRDRIIPRTQFEGSMSKYISRLGQFCTADYPTVDLSAARCKVIDDIYTSGSPRHLLTDGAGMIAPKMFEYLQTKFSKVVSSSCCAVQVRVQGHKGTLSVADISHFPEVDVVFRRSMEKFSSNDMTLCIASCAEYNPLKLNRDFLNLLFSIDTSEGWTPYNYLYHIQEKELCRLANILMDEDAALQELDSIGYATDSLRRAKHMILNEPFFVNLLVTYYHQKCRALRSKTQIPISDGCLLMGIPDPSGLLKDGEVFLQPHSPESETPTCVLGRALIWRNPCLDPGDLRCVQCVDIPDLRRYVNVLILPASGTCRRSLASECSGGDLDGDKFSIMWDDSVVPPSRLTPWDAVDYDMNAQKAKESYPAEESGSMGSVVAKTMCNTALGRIARKHMAYCDQKDAGAADPYAREAALAQALAVDYPKTGIPPRIPIKVDRIKSYPSFMENTTRDSYVSRKPLGMLYDRCISVVYDTNFATLTTQVLPQDVFLIPDREVYQDEANQVYKLYRDDIMNYMIRFGLKYESELILAMPLSLQNELSSDIGAVQRSLKIAWESIQRKYQEIFYQGLHDGTCRAAACKASAWYSAAYDIEREGYDGYRVLSFPWLVAEHLSGLCDSCNISTGWIYELVGSEVLALWKQAVPMIKHIVSVKMEVFEKIKAIVLKFNDSFRIEPYGSVAHRLCDTSSDLDIFVENTGENRMDRIEMLKEVASVLLDVSSNVRLVADTDVPVVKAALDSDTSGNEAEYVDVCSNEDGVNKARFIQAFYRNSACNIVIMHSLIEWAKCCGILQKSRVRKGEFHALVLSILYDPEIVAGDNRNEGVDIDSDIIDSTKKCKSTEVGEKLLRFFRLGQTKGGADFEYTWPVRGSPQHKISSIHMTDFSKCCAQAYHCLAVSRSWKELLLHISQNETQQSCVIKLPNNLIVTEELEKVRQFHTLLLENKTGARVEFDMSSAISCEVRGWGTRNQLRLLESEVYRLFNMGKYYLTGSIRMKPSVYFMEGSSFMFCRYASGSHAKMKFKPYLSKNFYNRHCFNERARPYLMSAKCQSWEACFKLTLKKKIREQLRLLLLEDGEEISMSANFGTFYGINATSSFGAGAILGISLHEIENAYKDNRRNKERAEYDDHRSVSASYDVDRQSNCHSSVEVTSADHRDDSDSERRKSIADSKKSRNGNFTSSFWSGITDDDVNFSNVYETVKTLLSRIGYIESSDDERKVKIQFAASLSYQASVVANTDGSIEEVYERPLNWVSATLLTGNGGEGDGVVGHDEFPLSSTASSIRRQNDIRFKVVTKKKLPTNHKLFKRATCNDRSPVVISESKLKLSEFLQPEDRERVYFARNVLSRKVFEYAVDDDGCPLKVKASLEEAEHFSGRELSHFVNVISLNLDFDSRPLVEWVNRPPQPANALDAWLDAVISHAILISDLICTNSG